MSQDLEGLRTRISTLKRSRGRGTGGGLYPILGPEVLRVAEELRAQGLGWPEVEAKIGLSKTTLACWKRKARQDGQAPSRERPLSRALHRERVGTKLVPVDLKQVPQPTTSTPLTSLTLTTPSGFKVEGLSEAQVRRLIGSLRCS